MFMNVFSRFYLLFVGARVWRDLDNQLPEPYGVMEDDTPRLNKFKSLVAKLSKRERSGLLKWLELQLWYVNNATPDLQTAREEELERKWRQIYDTHLEIVKSLA